MYQQGEKAPTERPSSLGRDACGLFLAACIQKPGYLVSLEAR